MLLANRFPLLLWWGPDYVSIYNDAYRPILGAKHPQALGLPCRECWSEIWHVLKPLIDSPYCGGPPTWIEDFELELQRHGFTEEAHFTVAYSPVPDDSASRGIGGVLATVHEITEKVIGERRIATLRELSARSAEAQTAEQACLAAAETLARSPKDVPFALIYLLDNEGENARLMAATGFADGDAVSPSAFALSEQKGGDCPWPVVEAMRTEAIVPVYELAARLPDVPPGPWSDPPYCAAVVPIRSNTARQLAGLLVAGVSSRLKLNDQYCSFLELAAGQIATAISNARAHEEQRQRAEALADIDRAKTNFFSNVSHEFRTPLTLMLGPIEEMAADPATPAHARGQLELAHRNALRLLKLVNSLLDFSRTEAGRQRASYEPTDLAELTRDLASTFRSAMERAGLAYTVECDELGESVYVDREMWEKIVLNLLSNAFKFTLQGSVSIRLRREADRVVLEVADTGVGVPPHELPRFFERFHRVEGVAGRTQEGSGIGLALVQELVRLHGGKVEVDSELGRGTTLCISMPFGTAHLASDRVKAPRPLASTAVGARPFVEEALRWVPTEDGPSRLPSILEAASTTNSHLARAAGARILLADDNADMRAYVTGLLEPSYVVEAVADGEKALHAARRERPDLILSDIMMPLLDGVGLLKALRSDESLRDVPVILLSARAGEEARVQGHVAGADDYLVKPFSARELVARVGALIDLTRMRRESEDRFHALVSATSEIIYRMSPDWSELRYLKGRDFIADTHDPSRSWLDEYIDPDDQPHVTAVIEEAIRTESTFQLEHRVRRVDGTLGWAFSRAIPFKDAHGRVIEWFGAASDITDRKMTERALREREEQLRLATEAAELGLWDVDLVTDTLYWPPRVKTMFGISPDVPVSMADFYAGLHPADLERTSEAFAAALDPQLRALYDVEYRTVGKEDGLIRWVAAKGRGIFDASGKCVRVIGTALDITARKHAEERLRDEARVQELLGRLSHALVGAQLEIKRVVQIATDAAREVSGAAFGAFFYNVQDDEGDRYMLYSLSGVPPEDFADFPQPRNTDLFAPTFRGEGVVRSGDITVDPCYGHRAPYNGMPKGHLPVRSYLAVPVKTASGEVLGGLFFGHPEPNVFDERAERLVLAIAAQAAVAFENARLHQASQQEIEQRKRAEEALSDADRRKDEFLAMLAHELRNPLSPITTAGELLSRTVGVDSRSKIAVEMIKRQAKQLTRLIDDLLDVSRITQGRIELRRSVVDLASIIAHAVETVEPQLRAKSQNLSTLAESYEPLCVNGDSARLVQCVANVLANAIKYTDTGGDIRVRTRAAGQNAVIEITDTGVGITEALLPKVFDLFVQSDRTLDRAQGGLGIGLAVVKRLIEMHGGEVTARSPAPGAGATFEIRLPRVARTQTGEIELAPGKVTPRRVLIVDDNQDAANSLAALLAFRGHEVKVAFNGAYAIELTKSFKPEVALLDLGLPEMDGYVLAGKLRALEQPSRLRLVAVTGYGQAEDRQRSQAAGFDDHLVKPTELAALERVLSALNDGS